MGIVERVDWPTVDGLVSRQQNNREVFSPFVSTYRWWARRPHAVAGALLDAAVEYFAPSTITVSDPFSGGGTVAFEAVERGLAVYAQELFEWPSFGLATSFRPAPANELRKAGEALLKSLSHHRRRYGWHSDSSGGELSHIIRVRRARCPRCDEWNYLFAQPLVSRASRAAGETQGFFGCVACGGINRRRLDVKSFTCSDCGAKRSTSHQQSRMPSFQCAHCDQFIDLSDELARHQQWRPVLVNEVSRGRSRVTLREVSHDDPVHDARNALPQSLFKRIPQGLESDHLIRSGFKWWSDLYTGRQLRVLSEALTQIESLDAATGVKERLKLCVLGAAEMAGYLCRWDRHYPKAYECIANHRFARTTVAVETNLLAEIGRGTIPRRLLGAEKSLNAVSKPGQWPTTRRGSAKARRRRFNSGALVVSGSSTRQLLQDKSVQLVLTDPPYHDDVQYGELARLFHVWMGVTNKSAGETELLEAVPNRSRKTDTRDYEQVVAKCLTECRRTLKRDGRVILTFHNRDLDAWEALTNSLVEAGYAIEAIATVTSENSTDHSKRGKKAFVCDLVLECVRWKHGSGKPSVCGTADGSQRQNLIEMGLAMAEKTNKRRKTELKKVFEERLRQAGCDEVLIN